MHYGSYGLPKPGLDKSLKKSCCRRPFKEEHGKRAQTLLQSE